MPLIILCGYPCSGKTRTAQKLKQYFEDKSHVVNLINEECLNLVKSVCYSDTTNEKLHRTQMKSEVEKNISDKTITIIDTLNLIKGTRYELYCLVRNYKTRHCVWYINTTLEKCLEFNLVKQEYDVSLLKDWYCRMEEPKQNNRWDCPMYTIYPDDEPPFEDICISLFEGKKPKEPVSSKSDIVFDTDFLFNLDKNCQEVINEILAQQDQGVGDCVVKINEEKSVYLSKKFSAIQLKKIKLEFIKISKVHPPKDKEESRRNFVEYVITVQDRF